MKKKAYSYIRWSSAKQNDNDSERRQREAAERWLERNKDEYVLDQTLTEQNSSFRGRNLDPKYGSLGKFIAAAEAENSEIPKGSALLIERLDRFSRTHANVAYNAIVRLSDAGIKVVIIGEGLEITSENNSDFKIILPAILSLCIANEESKKRSERIGEYWDEQRKKAREGNAILSPQLPAWCYLDVKTNTIKVDEKKAEPVRYIFKRTIEGVGQKLLCKEMNERYRPITKPRKNTKNNQYSKPRWNTSYLCDLLNNRQVIGELQPRKRNSKGKYVAYGKPIENYYPPIIDSKVFYAARMAIAQKKKEKYQETSKFVNLLAGLVFNGADKRKMHLMTTRVIRDGGNEYRQRRFQSHGKRDGMDGICPLSVDYYSLEKLVLLSLTELNKDELVGDFKPNMEKAKLLQAIAGYKNRIRELENTLTNTNEHTPVDSIVSAITKLQSVLERDEQEFESLGSITDTKRTKLKDITEVQKLFSTSNEKIDINARYELRRVIATIVRRIIVFPYKRSNRMVAARVLVELRAEKKYRRLILMKDRVNKKVPVITFFSGNHAPTIALCNVGMILWEHDDVGELGWRPVQDCKDGKCRIGDRPIMPTTKKEFEILRRAIFFHEREFLNASKAGMEFVDPFSPSKNLIDRILKFDKINGSSQND